MIDQKWLSFQFLLLTVSLLTIATLFIKYYIRKRKLFHLGNKLPGPKPLPLIGNALEFLNENDILRKVNKINEKYPLAAVWIGPNLVVFISRPEDVEICLTSPKLMDVGELYKFLEPCLGKGLLTANGAQWKKIRKIAAPAFHPTVVRNFVPIFHERSNILVNLLEKEVGKSSFLIFPYIKNCTFDIICETCMDVKLNPQECELEVLNNADRLMALIYTRMYAFWQQFDFLYKLTKDGKEHDCRIKAVHQFLDEEIAKKRKSINLKNWKKNEDASKGTSSLRNIFVDQMLQFDGYLNHQEIRENVLTVVVAGYETSSSATCFTLVMLAIHPEIQEKAYQEVKSVFDNLVEQKMEEDDLSKLEYLDMIIKETLRLFPTAPIVPRKATDDVYMEDYLIPKGAGVNMNFYALHRDPKQYKDPHKFDPDRFLPENVKKRHPFSYVPFGRGRRKCIGSEFSLRAVRVIVANILQKYKVECDYTMEDIELRLYITLKMKEGFPIRLVKR